MFEHDHITYSEIKMQFLLYGSHTMSSTCKTAALSLLHRPDDQKYLGKRVVYCDTPTEQTVHKKKTGNVRIAQHTEAFVQPLLQWKSNKYTSECVLEPWGLRVQCASAILSSAACPALQYFPTLFHKQHDFRKRKTY